MVTKSDYLKPGAAAEYLAISPRFLHTLSHTGRLAYIRLGPRCLRYKIGDLNAFLKSHTVGAK